MLFHARACRRRPFDVRLPRHAPVRGMRVFRFREGLVEPLVVKAGAGVIELRPEIVAGLEERALIPLAGGGSQGEFFNRGEHARLVAIAAVKLRKQVKALGVGFGVADLQFGKRGGRGRAALHAHGHANGEDVAVRSGQDRAEALQFVARIAATLVTDVALHARANIGGRHGGKFGAKPCTQRGDARRGNACLRRERVQVVYRVVVGRGAGEAAQFFVSLRAGQQEIGTRGAVARKKFDGLFGLAGEQGGQRGGFANFCGERRARVSGAQLFKAHERSRGAAARAFDLRVPEGGIVGQQRIFCGDAQPCRGGFGAVGRVVVMAQRERGTRAERRGSVAFCEALERGVSAERFCGAERAHQRREFDGICRVFLRAGARRRLWLRHRRRKNQQAQRERCHCREDAGVQDFHCDCYPLSPKNQKWRKGNPAGLLDAAQEESVASGRKSCDARPA